MNAQRKRGCNAQTCENGNHTDQGALLDDFPPPNQLHVHSLRVTYMSGINKTAHNANPFLSFCLSAAGNDILSWLDPLQCTKDPRGKNHQMLSVSSLFGPFPLFKRYALRAKSSAAIGREPFDINPTSFYRAGVKKIVTLLHCKRLRFVVLVFCDPRCKISPVAPSRMTMPNASKPPRLCFCPPRLMYLHRADRAICHKQWLFVARR